MTTKREGILAYVATLAAATSGVSSRVYRSRTEPVSREETPCIIVEAMQDTAEYSVIDYIDWSLQFKCTIFTRANIPDQSGDAIVQDLYSRLMADRSLGSRVFDIIPTGVYFNMQEGDFGVGTIELLFTCRYRTAASNLAA